METHVSRGPLDSVKSDQVIRAGAGTGKTYTLTKKALQLAKDHRREAGQWPRLVLTTFTRAATQELRERVLKYALEDAEDPVLIEFASSPHQLVISTLHGLADRFLRQSGLSVGLDPAFQILSETQKVEIERRALHNVLKSLEPGQVKIEIEPAAKWLGWLTELQRHQSVGPVVRSLSEAELAQEAGQEREQLRMDVAALRASFQGFESDLKPEDRTLFQSWLEIMATAVGSEEARNQGMARIKLINLQRGPRKGPAFDWKNDIKQVRAAVLANLKNETRYASGREQMLERQRALESLFPKFSGELRRLKFEQSSLAISDLEGLALELSRTQAGSISEEAKAFSAQFDHWLVDEYQDINPTQVQLLSLWSADRPRFMVGDPQQSIYLFRDAKTEVFLEAEQRAAKLDTLYELKVNRRSNPVVLEAVNSIVSRFEGFRTMEPFLGGFDDASPTRAVSPTPPILCLHSAEVDEEQRELVNWLQEQIRIGRPLTEIAILVRTHKDGLLVAKTLRRAGLPFALKSQAGPRERLEIRVLHALIAFLVDIDRADELALVLRHPHFGFSDDDWTQLMARSREQRQSAARILMSDRVYASSRAHQILSDLKARAAEEGVHLALSRLYFQGGLLASLVSQDASGLAEAHVFQAFSDLAMRARGSNFSWVDTLHELESAESKQQGEVTAAVSPNRIQVMTIHASKGLEFEAVAMPFLGRRIQAPRSKSLLIDMTTGVWQILLKTVVNGEVREHLTASGKAAKDREIEASRAERKRLLYVGLTRAKSALFLSIGKNSSSSLASELGLEPSVESSHIRYCSPDPDAKSEELPQVSRVTSVRIDEEKFSVQAGPRAGLAARRGSRSVSRLLDQQSRLERRANEQVGLVVGFQRAELGTQVHRLLEMLCYPSRERLEATLKLWFEGGQGTRSEESVAEAIRFCLEHPVLSPLIKDGHAEWGFIWNMNGLKVEGQIDLWGYDEQGQLWVVDYKTGQSSDAERAWAQLDVYSGAVLALEKSIDRVSQMLVYPFEAKVLTRAERPIADINQALRELTRDRPSESQAAR
jgi:ATP-dependent helicase/nuclease subunit A